MIELPKLKSVEIPDMGRFYRSRSKDAWYPSVTTVTGWSKRAFFAEWQKMKAAGIRGTAVHEAVEDYLIRGTVPTTSSAEVNLLFTQMQDRLDRIRDIVAMEQPLCSDSVRMAGRFDCIARYNGKLSVIDFKTSDRAKKEEWIQNYFHQAAAYSLMWYEQTGEKVDQTVILITCLDGSVQEFTNSPSEFYRDLSSAVVDYWRDNDYRSLQERIRARA
jgi:genome maintenance exonuclease 1